MLSNRNNRIIIFRRTLFLSHIYAGIIDVTYLHASNLTYITAFNRELEELKGGIKYHYHVDMGGGIRFSLKRSNLEDKIIEVLDYNPVKDILRLSVIDK